MGDRRHQFRTRQSYDYPLAEPNCWLIPNEEFLDHLADILSLATQPKD